METFKARLVAKGYTQKEGVGYEETFSSVAMIKSIHILLSIAACLDYEIWKMDVKMAFLNGYLEEIIYMMQPGGFVAKGQQQKVCKLLRPIYGLKQALQGLRICVLMKLSKRMVLSKMLMNLVYTSTSKKRRWSSWFFT